MGAVTYPDPEVEKFINEHFVPVQFDVVAQPEVMDQFNTPWTPTLIVQDAEGREHRRSQGYLDASRFLGEMALAWLKDAVDRRDFDEAQRRSAEALERTKGDPEREPEAVYWASVTGYKASNDPKPLIEGWNGLLDRHPESEWARKVAFLRM
jgi:hypothetical protein